jgi:hypothetical protein
MSEHVRPVARQVTIAAFCLAVALGGAFVAADVTRHDPIFSLSPPPPKNAPSHVIATADITETQRIELHRTFFTAWAALLLVIPALCLFPFRHQSSSAAGYWLAFWTTSFLAFAVHLYWATIVIFHGDWSQISSSTRVSAPVVDTVFAVWWGVDVLLAWTLHPGKRLVNIERTIVYVLAVALFIAASAIEGEIWLSKALGCTLAAAIAISILVWLTRRMRRRALSTAPVAG